MIVTLIWWSDLLLSCVAAALLPVFGQVENLRQLSSFNWGGTTVRVWRGVVEGLDTTFLEPENGMFWVGCIYGRNNDAQRWGGGGKEGWEPGQAGCPSCLVCQENQRTSGVQVTTCRGRARASHMEHAAPVLHSLMLLPQLDQFGSLQR